MKAAGMKPTQGFLPERTAVVSTAASEGTLAQR